MKLQDPGSIRAEIADLLLLNSLCWQMMPCFCRSRRWLKTAWRHCGRGGKIIFAGNGGSFADAQHLSAEFTSRFMFDRAPLASIALVTNNSAISAIGNYYGCEQVFARWLQGIAQATDVFVPISTRGNSANILAAVKGAREMQIATVVWTGETGGQLHTLRECVRIQSRETARIQECHILIGHILCGLVENFYFWKDHAK